MTTFISGQCRFNLLLCIFNQGFFGFCDISDCNYSIFNLAETTQKFDSYYMAAGLCICNYSLAMEYYDLCQRV